MMGKNVTFYGSSDDLIEVEGDVPGCDEYNGERATFSTCGLHVTVEYQGTWSVSIGQVDEDVPVTAEEISAGLSSNGYSMFLRLVVPDGSHIERIS